MWLEKTTQDSHLYNKIIIIKTSCKSFTDNWWWGVSQSLTIKKTVTSSTPKLEVRMPFSILTFLPIWTHQKLAAKARHSTHLDRCLGLISIPQDAWRQINCQKETRVYCTAMDESQTTQMLKSPHLCLNKMETLIHRYSHPLLSCSAICKINFQTKDWYLLTIANTSKISLSQMLWHSMVWSNSAFWTNP